MRVAFLLVFLALQDTSPREPHTAHDPAPGPRAAIEGLTGVRWRSTLDFGEAHNRFEALYAFPDRARWVFESLDRSSRQTIYRSGTRLFEVSGGPSTELEGAARDHALLQIELRRAALLWPHGFDWAADGEAQRATLFASSCCRTRPIGALLATGLADGRPRRIEALDPQGEAFEAIDIEAWKEQDGRTWPARLRVSGRSGSFDETVEEIDTRARYLDMAFLPGDRRTAPTDGPPQLTGDLVGTVAARFELPRGLGWSEARTRAEALRVALAERLGPDGPALDPVPSFELDAEARPVACRVRLRDPVADPPPRGFERRDGGTGLFLFLARPEELTAQAVGRLLRGVPSDATAGTPYVRFHEQRIEVVVPLEPR